MTWRALALPPVLDHRRRRPGPHLPHLGYTAPAPAPSVIGSPPQGPDQGIAIVGLILNILVLAGLGSLIGGRTTEGIWQLVLYLGGLVSMFVLMLTIIGIILIPLSIVAMMAGWVWGIVTGVQMVQAASQPRPAAVWS